MNKKRKSAIAEQETHHRRAEMGQATMKSDSELSKTEGGILVMSFDMQLQLFVPHLTYSQMFYSRQLGVWNFGVHIENKNVGFMILWPETCGSRGSIEVASCLYNIFTTHIITNVLQPLPRKLVLWSDNCGSQNKNQYVVCMYKTLIAKGFFDEIVHKFPTCGHTFLSCDRDFALIEKKKWKSSPQVPQDLVKLIAPVKQQNPFILIDTPPFIDWKSLARETVGMKNLKISQVSELKVSAQSFGSVGARLGHAEITPWIYTNVLKNGVAKEFFKNYNLIQINNEKGLTAAKKNDIRAMLPFLRHSAKEYYQRLLETVSNTTD